MKDNWIGPTERAERDARLRKSISGKKSGFSNFRNRPTIPLPLPANITNYANLKLFEPVSFKTPILTSRLDVAKGGYRAIEQGVLNYIPEFRQNRDEYSKTHGTIGAAFDFSTPGGTQYDVKYVRMTPTKNNIDWERTTARLTKRQHEAYLSDPNRHKFIVAFQGIHQMQNQFTMRLLQAAEIQKFDKET